LDAQRMVRQPDVRPRTAPGDAVPCRDDTGNDRSVVRQLGRRGAQPAGAAAAGADAVADAGGNGVAAAGDARTGEPPLRRLDPRPAARLKRAGRPTDVTL